MRASHLVWPNPAGSSPSSPWAWTASSGTPSGARTAAVFPSPVGWLWFWGGRPGVKGYKMNCYLFWVLKQQGNVLEWLQCRGTRSLTLGLGFPASSVDEMLFAIGGMFSREVILFLSSLFWLVRAFMASCECINKHEEWIIILNTITDSPEQTTAPSGGFRWEAPCVGKVPQVFCAPRFCLHRRKTRKPRSPSSPPPSLSLSYPSSLTFPRADERNRRHLSKWRLLHFSIVDTARRYQLRLLISHELLKF